MVDLSHKGLCDIAVKWLKRAHSAGGPGCMVAVSEVAGGWTGEIPDAIGFSLSHWETGATVIEVKVTRSDFLGDRKKPHRQPGAGMGAWRYYMAPEGLIRVDELPPGWGLIEVNTRGHCKVLAGAMFEVKKSGYDQLQRQVEEWRQPCALDRELWLLVKLLARIGDPEKLNQERREQFRAQHLLVARLKEKDEEIERLRADVRWQTRRDRLAEQAIGAIPKAKAAVVLA